MKKLLISILSFILTISLVACGSNENSKNDAANNDSAKVEEQKQEPLVTIEELPMDIVILEPDSIGTRYMEATFTNNSKYAIKGFNVTVLLKDKNEKTYLSTYDTVMPGETSSKFETFAPDTGDKNDIEYLQYEITVINEEGKEVYLTYDSKLKTYEWY